jgi:hypothetical protein
MVSGVPLDCMHSLYLVLCKHFLEMLIQHLDRGFIIGPDGERMKKRTILDSRIKITSKLCPVEFD